jgi:tetratricopeptide (TPR) repeat protein
MKIMDDLGAKIATDKDFACFEALFIGLEAFNLLLKGYHSDSITLFEKGLGIARKYDDLPLVADGLYYLAELIKRENIPYAIELMLEQKAIAEELGYAWALARDLIVLGRIMMLRGEYDLALDYLLEYHQVTKTINHPAAYTTYSIAFLYNILHQGKEALAFLKRAEGRTDGKKRHLAEYHLQLAYSYMNIGNKIHAYSHLDVGKQLAVQSGIQGALHMHQLLEGIFEKLSGDLPSAKNTLENLYDIFGDQNHIHKNLCLFHLADIELESASIREIDGASWLRKFENHVNEKEYPGFIAQVKMLKAKQYRMSGKQKESWRLINEVLELANKPSMFYLRNMMYSLIPEE